MFTFRYDDLVRVYRQTQQESSTTTETTTEETESTEGTKSGDAAGLKSALDKVRAADKANKQKIKDLEAKLADADTSKSEAEKLAARLETLEQANKTLRETNRTATAKDEVTRLAKAAGAPDTEAIWKMARADVKYDEDSNAPENAKELVDALKTDHPDMFKVKPGKADQGGGQQNDGTSKGWMRKRLDDARGS